MARTAVVAGTATAVSNNVSRRQAAKWSDQQAEQPVQSAPPADDMTTQIEQLNQLKEKGMITQEEFDAKKKQILGI